MRPAGPLDPPEEIEGACLETLVYQELSALNEYLGLEYALSYWRTAEGAEVDFVLYGQRGIVAIEVKRTRRLSSSDYAGLAQFRADYPQARCILLAGVPAASTGTASRSSPSKKASRRCRTSLPVPEHPAAPGALHLDRSEVIGRCIVSARGTAPYLPAGIRAFGSIF